MREARRVAADVSTRELDQLGEVFTAHRRLASQSRLQSATIGLERALTERTLEFTEATMANYRMALPTVREAQWTSARDALRRAVPIAPGDRRLLAGPRHFRGQLPPHGGGV